MSDAKRTSISVVIPAYNESSRILPTIEKIDRYCAARFEKFEIIVVNDGSLDDTEKLVAREKEKLSFLHLESYKKNRGKGYAIRRGVSAASSDLILLSDADLSTPIEEVEKMLEEIERGYDIVIGSRALKESDIAVRQPWWRESMGRAFNLFVRLLLSLKYKDTQCGFKILRRSCAVELFGKAVVDRFSYDVEILYLAEKSGFKIKEVPVRWINSPASKVNPLRDPLQMMKDIIKMRLRRL